MSGANAPTSTVVVVNFSHPLSADDLAAIGRIAGATVGRVINVPAQFDADRAFGEQAEALVGSVGFTPGEWQSVPVVVSLPSLNTVAALLLAEVHGRRGSFPAIVRSRRVGLGWEVAEVIDLQGVRDSARAQRAARP